jgi:aspartyl protease family protein
MQGWSSGRRCRGSGTLMLVIGWLMVVGLVYWAFHGWADREQNPNRTLAPTAAGEIVLQRNREGHYVASGQVNGVDVTFLVDTGATQMALPTSLARQLGLKLGPPIQLKTAAGNAVGYPTRLASVRLGNMEQKDLAGLVTDGLDADVVLLGMNFLRRTEMVQRGDRLILKPLTGG